MVIKLDFNIISIKLIKLVHYFEMNLIGLGNNITIKM